MEEQTLQRLNRLGDQLRDLYKPIRSAYFMSPTNRTYEKVKFLDAYKKGEPYNPQFTYPTPPSNWDIPLKEFSLELKPDSNIWESLLYKGVAITLRKLKALETRDPLLLTQSAIESYGNVSDDLVSIARHELEHLLINNEPCDIAAEEMANTMREAVDRAGLNNWTILVEENMNAKMSVRSIEKQIKINQNRFFSVSDLKRLLVHEIGTHVFRSVNGSLQPLKLLQMGLHGYIATEEGLANYHEAYYNVQTPSVQRLYALRVIAVYKSLSYGFYDVFEELIQYTNFDEAFDIALRAKRGFTDTSKSGCHVKDKVYFEGFLQVSSHLQKFPEDYPFLMCGKVSLELIPMLKEMYEIGILNLPKCLPSNLLSEVV